MLSKTQSIALYSHIARVRRANIFPVFSSFLQSIVEPNIRRIRNIKLEFRAFFVFVFSFAILGKNVHKIF